MEAFAAVDEFSKSFEEEFCFIACISSAAVSYMWFVDSGSSCHVTGCKEVFTRLREGGVNPVIEIEDDRRYKAQGVSTVAFQRGSGKPL
jgi:hypothetical protein